MRLKGNIRTFRTTYKPVHDSHDQFCSIRDSKVFSSTVQRFLDQLCLKGKFCLRKIR
jgi:hypothetical protein